MSPDLSKYVTAFLFFSCSLLLPACSGGTQVCSPGETQACACAGGASGVQTCNSSGSGWGVCAGCPGTPPPSDAGTTMTMCRPSGVAVLTCGCWGPAVEGQVVAATGCCSGFAVQTRCTGFCPGGDSSWGNICR